MIRRLKRQTKRRHSMRGEHRWFGRQTVTLDLGGTLVPMRVKNMRAVFTKRSVRYMMERDEPLALPIIGAPFSPDVWTP